jgi:hypothetical protein
MNPLRRQVQLVQRRLWINRGLVQFGRLLAVGVCAWLIIWLCDRLFALRWPMGLTATGLFTACAIGAFVWCWRTRDEEVMAAAILDEAAGLRERVSTALTLSGDSDDEFSKAVIADAQRVTAGLAAGKLVPIRWTRSLTLSSALLAAALISLLLPVWDVLGRDASRAKADAQQRAVNRVASVVAKPVSVMQEVLDKNADLAAQTDLKSLDDMMKKDQRSDPEVLRREAAKKLDRLDEALRQKRDSERFKSHDEMKNRLAQMEALVGPKNDMSKVQNSLSNGNFEEARKALDQARESLAKRARDGRLDAKQAQDMQKQLDDMAAKLDKAGEDKQSQRELQNAGLSEQEAKRILDSLAKKDPKQLEQMAKEMAQRLKDKGVDVKQVEEMLKKMQQRQKSCKQIEALAQKMSCASKQMGQGGSKGAEQELSEASDQLGEMEQMEQALNDIDGQLSDLDEAREELEESEDSQCSGCNGTGTCKNGKKCVECSGGAGGLAGKKWGTGHIEGGKGKDDQTPVKFENKKVKTRLGRDGGIIGQRYIKGEALKGQTDLEVYNAASAAEIDATDALNRDKIPRSYRKGVKRYFDRLGEELKPSAAEDSSTATPANPPEADTKE